MDIPPDHRAVIVLVQRYHFDAAASNTCGLGFSTSQEQCTMGSEKRAILRQEEGERRARVTWGRSGGDSRGQRRTDRPGRVERGFGAASHSGKAFERKRKAIFATLR